MPAVTSRAWVVTTDGEGRAPTRSHTLDESSIRRRISNHHEVAGRRQRRYVRVDEQPVARSERRLHAVVFHAEDEDAPEGASP